MAAQSLPTRPHIKATRFALPPLQAFNQRRDGKHQTVDMGERYWQAQIETTDLSAALAGEYKFRKAQRNGRGADTLYLFDASRERPLAYANATPGSSPWGDPRIVAVDRAAGTVDLEGFVAGAVVSEGDYGHWDDWRFRVKNLFDFTADVEGCAATNATLVQSGSIVTLTPTTSDPQFYGPATSPNVLGSLVPKVRARIRWVSGANDWTATPTAGIGTVYYTTAGHSYSGSYRKSIPAPVGLALNQWVVAEWDMSDLTVGGTDWLDSIITRVRIDLTTNSTGVWEIDWVAYGFDALPARRLHICGAGVADADGKLYGLRVEPAPPSGLLGVAGVPFVMERASAEMAVPQQQIRFNGRTLTSTMDLSAGQVIRRS